MMKTTVYLPDDLKRSIEQAAAIQQVSEAAFIRAALETAVSAIDRPKPEGALLNEDWGNIDWNTNGWLEGFGES